MTVLVIKIVLQPELPSIRQPAVRAWTKRGLIYALYIYEL
jgi:hypothetical protein